MRVGFFGGVAGVVLGLSQLALADSLVLKDGRRLEGVVSEVEDAFIIEGRPVTRIKKDAVDSVSYDPRPTAPATYDGILAEIRRATDFKQSADLRIASWLCAQFETGRFTQVSERRQRVDPVEFYTHRSGDCNEYAEFIANLYTRWTGRSSECFVLQRAGNAAHMVAFVSDLVYDVELRPKRGASSGLSLQDWLARAKCSFPVAIDHVVCFDVNGGEFRRQQFNTRRYEFGDDGFPVLCPDAAVQKRVRDSLSRGVAQFDRYFKFDFEREDRQVPVSVWPFSYGDGIVPAKGTYLPGDLLVFENKVDLSYARQVGWTILAPDGSVYWRMPDSLAADEAFRQETGPDLYVGEGARFAAWGFAYKPALRFTKRSPAGTYTVFYAVVDKMGVATVHRTSFNVSQ